MVNALYQWRSYEITHEQYGDMEVIIHISKILNLPIMTSYAKTYFDLSIRGVKALVDENSLFDNRNIFLYFDLTEESKEKFRDRVLVGFNYKGDGSDIYHDKF